MSAAKNTARPAARGRMMTANPRLADDRPVFGASRAPVPALTAAEAALWAQGTEDEMALARAAVSGLDIEAAFAGGVWMPLELAQRLSLAKDLFVPASLVAERLTANPRLRDLQQ
jgi:hypothetical protein